MRFQRSGVPENNAGLSVPASKLTIEKNEPRPAVAEEVLKKRLDLREDRKHPLMRRLDVSEELRLRAHAKYPFVEVYVIDQKMSKLAVRNAVSRILSNTSSTPFATTSPASVPTTT